MSVNRREMRAVAAIAGGLRHGLDNDEAIIIDSMSESLGIPVARCREIVEESVGAGFFNRESESGDVPRLVPGPHFGIPWYAFCCIAGTGR